MEFDRDRLAKLAGIRGDEAPTQAAQPVRTSASGIIRERRTKTLRSSFGTKRLLEGSDAPRIDSGTIRAALEAANIPGLDVSNINTDEVANLINNPTPEVENIANKLEPKISEDPEFQEALEVLSESKEAAVGFSVILAALGAAAPFMQGLNVQTGGMAVAGAIAAALSLWGAVQPTTREETGDDRSRAYRASKLSESRSIHRSSESADVSRLREIIRSETRSMIAEARAQRALAESGDLQRIQGRRSLREAAAMGFYGPGFAGSPRPVLGGPMSSSGRLAWLTEAEAAPADAGAEPIKIDSGDIGEILKGLDIKVDPEAVVAAIESPTAKVEKVADDAEDRLRAATGDLTESDEPMVAAGLAGMALSGTLTGLLMYLEQAGLTAAGKPPAVTAVEFGAGIIMGLMSMGLVIWGGHRP